MATKKEQELVQITPVELASVQIRLIGDTPLLVHNWTEKAKKQMLDTMTGKKAKKREAKDPVYDFINSAYWLAGKPEEDTEEGFIKAIQSGKARFGFPSSAVKQAGVSAAYRNEWSKDKVSLMGQFQVWGVDDPQFITIKKQGDGVMIPEMQEDPVTVGISGTDLRYRPRFDNWYADVIIRYNVNGKYKLNDLINIINLGGFACGIGEWRPEKSGNYGMFHVELSD